MTEKELAISAAFGAGSMLRENIGKISSMNIEKKRPFDFVTDIDKKAEEHIIKLIKKHFPNHEILAEESSKDKISHDICWIIDPLDGTTNFIHEYPINAVSIALEKEGVIVIGVVYDPHRDELFFAEKGKGAFLNDKPISVSRRENLKHCLIATGFPFKNRQYLDHYWKVLSDIFMEVSGIRRTGSAALDLANIACGRFDGFWELKLSPWDVAAGSLLIKEAGGRITDFEGTDNHVWSGDVIASNNLIHDFLLSKVQTVFTCNP